VRSFLGFRRRHRQVRRPESKGSARRIFCVFLTVLSFGLERGQTNIVWRVAVVYICIFRLSNVSCLAVLSPMCIAVLESIYLAFSFSQLPADGGKYVFQYRVRN